MRLLRLEISGFKSFCDKIHLSFVQDGISVVVGPNGCGKSNIVDAIRWTLGEQSAKHLRGASMEDVIFNGSSARQAVSMAQVTLVFSNPSQDTLTKYAEFSEISVTRRLYRSGESQYMINKTACRLTDIRELFMDTGIGGQGYSIIEQGKIEQIVTSRAENRRTIIDEAAGIVRYKAKRKEAERKFDATKQNLLRVEDIISELKRQEETLVTQVEQAEKYLEKKARLERLQQCTAATRWFKLKLETDKITGNRAKNQTSMDDLETKASVYETDLTTAELELARKESSRNQIQEQLQDKKEEIIKLESKLESDAAAIENLEEWQTKGDEESDLLNKQIKTVEFQIETHQKETKRLAGDIDANKKVLEQAEEKEKVQNEVLFDIEDKLKDLRESEVNIITRLTKDQNLLSQATERLMDLDEEAANLESDAKEIQEELDASNTGLQDIRNQIEAQRTSKEKLQGKIETLQTEKEEKAAILEKDRDALNALTRDRDQTENRIQSLNELIQSHEGYDSATKQLLDYFDTHPAESNNLGYIGTLAELVNPPDVEMPQATAFLNRYFNLVIFKSYRQLGSITEVINQLEIEQLQLFFLDLAQNADSVATIDWISARDMSIPVVPLAGDFQSSDTPLQDLPLDKIKAAGGLIDPARVIMTKAKIFLVGKPGQSNQAEQFFNRQREVETLEVKLEEVSTRIQEKESRVQETEGIVDEVSNSQERLKKEMIDLDLKILGLEKERDSKSIEIDRLTNQTKQKQKDQERAGELKKELISKSETLTFEVNQGEQAKLDIQNSIASYREKIKSATDNRNEFADVVQKTRVSLASLIEKQNNNDDILTRLEKDIEDRKKQLEAINSRVAETKGKRDWYTAAIKKSKTRLPELLEEHSAIESDLTRLKNEIETETVKTAELRDTIKAERGKIASLGERNHKLEVKLAQLIQESTNIADNMFAENSVHPEEIIGTFDVNDFNIEKEAENIAQLKQTIGVMDDVNLAAKKEYDALKERLDFLTGQSADLVQSLEALEHSIQKINQESRRRFRDMFKLINTRFSELFPKLFGGGEAYLELTDESDLLETGVEIIAKPPGKKLQNMMLLSGGEKALTAIALIFAIFQIKPSPFCLLDEVDAPLDEANNVRFNRHVKLLTENSQFIIITHNKKTMEIGDALFGVTMEEPGVSKIVSVDFAKMALGA